MKYKSRHGVKYFLLFVFISLFDQFKTYIPFNSFTLTQVEDKIGICLLIIIAVYEIHARRKFDQEHGLPSVILEKDELIYLLCILVAVVLVTFNPFHR